MNQWFASSAIYDLKLFSKDIQKQYAYMQCLIEHSEGKVACKPIFLTMKHLGEWKIYKRDI